MNLKHTPALTTALLAATILPLKAELPSAINSDYILDASYSVNYAQTVSGNAVYTIDTFGVTNSLDGYALTVNGGSVNIQNGGSLLCSGGSNAGMRFDFTSGYSTLTVAENAGSVSAAKIYLGEKSVLNLQKENAIAGYGSKACRLMTVNSTTLNMAESQTFTFDIRSAVYLNIAEGKTLNIASCRVNTDNSTYNIYVKDFSNSDIFLADNAEYANVYSLAENVLTVKSVEYGVARYSQYVFNDYDGNAIDGLSLTETSGGLLLTAVPEPAEWAAILGALALAAAFARRSKQK